MRLSKNFQWERPIVNPFMGEMVVRHWWSETVSQRHLMIVPKGTPFNLWVCAKISYALWNTPLFKWSWNLEKEDFATVNGDKAKAFRRAYPNLELFLDFKDWGN